MSTDKVVGYPVEDWFVLFLYIIIALFGIIGNSFIIRVIFKRSMNTTTFALVGNQAFSDVVYGIAHINMFFFCSAKLNSVGGQIGFICCKIVHALAASTFRVSALSMAVISIERYIKLQYRQTKQIIKPLQAMLGIWVFSIWFTIIVIMKLPTPLYFAKNSLIGCRPAFDTKLTFMEIPAVQVIYNLLFAITYFSPIVVTVIMYVLVVRTIYAKKTSSGINRTENQTTATAIQQSKRKTTKMLILMSVVYIVSCTPVAVLGVIYKIFKLEEDCTEDTRHPISYRIPFIIAYSSICVNPIIYCYYNEIFREEAKQTLSKIKNCILCRKF